MATPTVANPTGKPFVCGFCGLLCDDLRLEEGAAGVSLSARCPRAERGLADHARGRAETARHRVAGQPAELEAALRAAAALLAQARAPVIEGLASDVAGARAALRLADRLGAGLTHMNGAAMRRNLLALQSRGGFTTTFAEVRNRADVALFVGTDGVTRFPRLVDRLFSGPAGALFGEPTARRLTFLGPAAPPLADAEVTHLACELPALFDALAALRALLAGTALAAEAAGGVPRAALAELAARLAGARYGVVVWAAAELDLPHADLLVESLHELVKALNATTRCAALPLAGSDGDLTAQQVLAWTTGYPPPLELAGGVPRHEPRLPRPPCDARLWISCFDPERRPPDDGAPTVVLGHPAMSGLACAAFIAAGVPGLDHPGQLFRADGVVALPLYAPLACALPSAAQALDRLLALLEAKGDAPC